MKPDRKDILLRAAFDLLRRAEDERYVEHAPSILVRYDDADCDGLCLLDDIAEELGIDRKTKPIPTTEKE